MTILDRLLGGWAITMHHVAMTEPVPGHQRFERVLDGAFVLQHWTFQHPDFPDAMAFWSPDVCHYFDVRGVIRVFELEFGDHGWSMLRLDDDFAQRFVARFDGDDHIETSGELSRDGGATWQHDFTMTHRRLSG
jgi:hypothetical protein